MTTDLPVMSLPIADIAIGDRIGFFNADHADQIGARMAVEGQRHPIQVQRNGNAAAQSWTLVAGLHRLRGANRKGWLSINAIQVAGPNANVADLRRLELAENIDHRHRRPIERAIMMEAHALLEEAVDYPDSIGEAPKVRAGRARHSAAANVAAAENWLDRTAKAFGVSRRQLERHRRIYREIYEALPELAQKLNDHPIGESLRDLERLASFPFDAEHNNRRAAIEHLLSQSDWKSLNAALEDAGFKQSNGNRVHPDNHCAVISNAWGKMRLHEKRQYLDEFPKMLTKPMAEKLVVNLMREFDL